MLLRGAARGPAARPAEPAAASRRVARHAAALRRPRPGRASPSCSTGSTSTRRATAGVETIVELDRDGLDLAATPHAGDGRRRDARRRRRLADRHERHHRDAEARDAHPREPARRGRRDARAPGRCATTTCSARRSRSATSPGTTCSALHRRARPVVLMRRFDPARLVELVVEHGVTLLSLAPTMIAMLLDDPRTDDDVLAVRARDRVRRVGDPRAGAARRGRALGLRPLAGLRHDRAVGQRGVPRRRRAPRAPRPATTGCSRAAGYPRRASSSGSTTRTDEILVRAPQVMAGLLAGRRRDRGRARRRLAAHRRRRPDRRRRAAHRRRPDQGRDRVSGGENVASREVEAVLHTHPGVADVAVIGLPDERWGERVAAVVVRRRRRRGDAPRSSSRSAAVAPRRLQGPARRRVRRRAAPQRRRQGAQAAAARRARRPRRRPAAAAVE